MVKEVVNLRWVHFSVKGMLGENVRKLLDVVSSKNTYCCVLDAVTSSGILKAQQKLGVTFNPDKLGGIDFSKFSKMCSV